MNENEAPYLQPVYDFGLSDVELDALLAIPAPTEREIATQIVGEAELLTCGRWGGGPAPKRWIPLIRGWADLRQPGLTR
jgi:hypothetical protein